MVGTAAAAASAAALAVASFSRRFVSLVRAGSEFGMR